MQAEHHFILMKFVAVQARFAPETMTIAADQGIKMDAESYTSAILFSFGGAYCVQISVNIYTVYKEV